MTGRVFPVVPAHASAFWVILAIAAFLLMLVALFGRIAYGARHARFEVTEQGLLVKGGIFGRFIRKESLLRVNAKIVNLNLEWQYRPRLKTNGIGLPGYQEGWFRLRSGEKALLFLTERSRVVYLPTKEGFSVLLSTGQPEELLRSMADLWKD